MLAIAKSSKLAKMLRKAIRERGKCLIKRITMELISVIKLSYCSSMFERYTLSIVSMCNFKKKIKKKVAQISQIAH